MSVLINHETIYEVSLDLLGLSLTEMLVNWIRNYRKMVIM